MRNFILVHTVNQLP